MGVVANTCTDTKSRFGDLLWVMYDYEFANAQHYTIGPKKMPSFSEAETECDALIPTVEADMIERSRRKAADAVVGSGTASPETVTPDFPEELPASDSDVSVDTRRRGFHRWLVRWVWPQDLLVVDAYLSELWLWLEQMTLPNLQTYLAVDVATANAISQRMGNAVTVGGLVDADELGEIS